MSAGKLFHRVDSDTGNALAPTPSAIRKLLNICDDYAREYSIIFNGIKSKCIFYPGSKEVGHASMAHVIPSLQVGGIEYIDS